MPLKLRPEEIVTIDVLHRKGVSNSEIARTLDVTEGNVRYHLRRKAEGATDGRQGKAFRADPVAEVIDRWIQDQERGAKEGERRRPANLSELHEFLVREYEYKGTVRSIQRYVCSHYARPKIRPYRRVETPAGAQGQVDWADFPAVDIGDGPQKLFAFVMTLSHSRKEAVVWSPRTDQLAWHHCHNEGFRRLEGVFAVARIDNLKTGIGVGAGPWGEVNEAYRAYARSVGFHVDACRPRSPEDKGKVERRVGAIRARIDPSKRPFLSLAELQAWSDERLDQSVQRRICPVTGKTVWESWQDEKAFLQPLPILPEVFDVVVTRPVHGDCTVNFEGRTYSVPFRLAEEEVEIHGCANTVQFLHDGQVVAEHPRHTMARLLINPAHYEGPGDDRVDPPVPLGRMGRRLVEIAMQPVEVRPVNLYAALAEVAR
jgi:transposase